MINIPIYQNVSVDFSQTIDLDESPYVLRMTWNTRIESWFMDILDSSRNNLVLGLKIVSSAMLLRNLAIDGLPPGDFLIWDSEATPENYGITLDNLGTRYFVIYLTEEEIENL